ncbi:DoxX family protein [Mucilaginibacter sp. UR6-1]|uniref:DoxX family protein n=1 Tax=Mucilaginibacter sp. UR6-1 TaxID=1435643 RepID=UPI001E4F8A75|nr:DoxX family protein [Mucilaginibacter sp. UR6-1]MCC8408593.1 DoxX family protein [Mucilaginibacter sp. UR6-1]
MARFDLPQLCVNNQKQNVMNLKTSKTIYWSGAIFISLWFGASGFFELTKNPIVWDITVKLGYPPHFIYILGVAKLLGVAVLLTPNRLLRLKEWVFAGIFFDITFAFFSKLAVLGFAPTIDAIVAFTAISITYIMFRKLYPAIYTKSGSEQVVNNMERV